MRSTTPQDAKARIDKALADGTMTPQQFQSLKKQAQSIASMMGLK